MMCVCVCVCFPLFSLPFHQILIYVVCVSVYAFVSGSVEQNGGGMVCVGMYG